MAVSAEIRTILVPLDGSAHSLKGLDRAVYLAKLSGASITIAAVVTVYPTLASTVVDYRKYLTGKFKAFLESAKSKAEKKGVRVDHEVLQGQASTEIIKYAKRRNFDLIVMGSRGLHGLKAKLVGSVSMAVVTKSSVPVLIVK